MATRGHLNKFKGLKVSSTHGKLNQSYMERMVVREPQLREENLHPDAKKQWNAMMAEPLPLTFKLHDWPVPEVQAKIDAMNALTQAKIDAGEIDKTLMPEHNAIKSTFVPLNKPLGVLEELPFDVVRTHKGNLPVYTDRRAGGQRKVTVVRKIYGDIDAFKEELSKIVSNSPIEDKQGRLEVSGFHTQKIKLWLTRLGF